MKSATSSLQPVHACELHGWWASPVLSSYPVRVWYNAGGGGDTSVVVHHLINELVFLMHGAVAIKVVVGTPLLVTEPLLQWFSIVGSVEFPSVQVQYTFDMEVATVRIGSRCYTSSGNP